MHSHIEEFSDEDINLTVEQGVQRQKARETTIERRVRTIHREHAIEGRKLSDMERLRQQAARLARKAGAKKVRASDFEGRTPNQLRNIIREAHAVLTDRVSA
jgi:hypothetical protein